MDRLGSRFARRRWWIAAAAVLFSVPGVVLSFVPVRGWAITAASRALYVALSAGLLWWLLRQREHPLDGTERAYRNLLHTFREPMIVHCRGTIVDANDHAKQLFGDHAGRLIGMPVLDLVHPEHLEEVTARIQQVYDTGRGSDFYELRMLRLDGTVIHVTAAGLPVTFQGQPAIQVMFRDVTQRKQMEITLKEAVDRFRLIETHMSDHIALIRQDGAILYASPGVDNIVASVPRQDPSGDAGTRGDEPWDCQLADHVHPEDLPVLREKFAHAFENSTPFTAEIRVRQCDGQWRVAELRAAPVPETDCPYKCMVVVSRDITDRRMTEELLRRSERLNAVGELAAGFAHEIRNPITVIRGFVQLAQKNVERLPHYLPIILQELERVETVTGELLRMAKPVPANFELRDVCKLLRETASLIEGSAVMANVRLLLRFDHDPAYVYCQENHLKQVFINVLKNAMEAMPAGGDVAIEVKDFCQTAVKIRFLDEGQGVPPAVLDRLGQPFNSTKSGGTGLGLVVCQRIVDQHGGVFSIRNRPQTGAEVEIILPAVSLAPPPTESPAGSSLETPTAPVWAGVSVPSSAPVPTPVPVTYPASVASQGQETRPLPAPS
ncbi:MAG: PAS domain S-box protein [Alicyclobacillus sp.]|nr:PAS domain S-box protein [Alicyclobacillus sp.]